MAHNGGDEVPRIPVQYNINAEFVIYNNNTVNIFGRRDGPNAPTASVGTQYSPSPLYTTPPREKVTTVPGCTQYFTPPPRFGPPPYPEAHTIAQHKTKRRKLNKYPLNEATTSGNLGVATTFSTSGDYNRQELHTTGSYNRLTNSTTNQQDATADDEVINDFDLSRLE